MALDLILIVGLVGWLISLGLDGRMSPKGAALCLIGLVFLVALARSQSIGAARLVFRFGVPIASLAASIVAYGNGDLHSIGEVAGAIGGLIFTLFGFYLVFRAVLGHRRQKARD